MFMIRKEQNGNYRLIYNNVQIIIYPEELEELSNLINAELFKEVEE